MRIEDPKKAEEMAYAEKPLRERAIKFDNPRWDREAVKAGEEAGEKYDQEKLKEERAARGEPEKKSEVDLERFRARVGDLVDAGRRLAVALMVREEDGLSCLMEAEAVRVLNSKFIQLEEAAQAQNEQEIDDALSGIGRLLDGVGRAERSSRGLKEDTESLDRVSAALRTMGEGVQSARYPELGEELVKKLNRIFNIAEEKWGYIRKRRDLIDSYNSGRRY